MIITPLLACNFFGSQYPSEVIHGVEDRAIRTVRTDRLSKFIDSASDEVQLNVVDVTLSDRHEERRAFLTFSGDQYKYLGPLQQLTPDIPLEFIFFDINGTRFIAIWILQTATEHPTFVTVGRSEQLASDDSMRVLSTGEVSNRVAIIYIPSDQSHLWQELTTIRVAGREIATEYAWEAKFNPPLSIDTNFIEVNLP